MANALYTKMVTTMSGFVGDEKAKMSVDRQLERVEATEDNVATGHLSGIVNYLIGAATLYVPDKGKQAELKAQLQAIA